MARRTTRKKATRKKARTSAGRRKKATRRTKGAGDLIISKSRTKAASNLNVSSEFYGALDDAVRALINTAQARAENNGRRTLRPHDL